MSEFKGKTAVITGGSRGIGAAVTLKLASLGVNVAFSYMTSQPQAKAIEKQAAAMGVKARAYAVDVKDFKKVKEWIAQVNQDLSAIDYLVNNAGVVVDKPLMMMGEEDWKQVIDTNLTGVFNVSRACIVGFMKRRSGNIVNISSVSGIIGLAGQTNYSASKGGVNAFTKALAKEVASFNIRVNAVAPGFIETDMLAGLKAEKRDSIKEYIPAKRLGCAEDVASSVVFLLSNEAGYITGEIIQVDGGLALR
jgi:3-oxoacyl-[acyl-carrier protein] reductase